MCVCVKDRQTERGRNEGRTGSMSKGKNHILKLFSLQTIHSFLYNKALMISIRYIHHTMKCQTSIMPTMSCISRKLCWHGMARTSTTRTTLRTSRMACNGRGKHFRVRSEVSGDNSMPEKYTVTTPLYYVNAGLF